MSQGHTNGQATAPGGSTGGRGGTGGGGAARRGWLGIDIGGSGIKGAPVDLRGGKLLADRDRIPTPQPAIPEAVVGVIAEVASAFQTRPPLGCTFPGVIKDGTVRTAAHLDPTWVGMNVRDLFTERLGRPVTVLNDADAAGMAEMAFGAGRGRTGLVVMVTVGTGIGTALFLDGLMIPNTELGHLEVNGKVADRHASDGTRKAKGLTWKQWAKRLDRYLERLEALLSPEAIIIGGGVSSDPERFLPRLRRSCEVATAELGNRAGIIGAALASKAATDRRGSLRAAR